MKKNFKWLTALAVVGTIIGLIIAYAARKNDKRSGLEEDGFDEDEDFDLDGDLKPVSEREYVPLNKTADPAAQKTEAEETEEKDRDVDSEKTQESPANHAKDQADEETQDEDGSLDARI